MAGISLGERMLWVAVRHAVAMVPVVGPVLSFGVDVLDAVRQEVAESRKLTEEQMVAEMRTVEQARLDHIVDTEMTTPAGEQALANLKPAQVVAVSRQLSRLPAELDQAVRQAKQRDRQRKVRAAADRREASVRTELVRDEQRRQLEATLTAQINQERWRDAKRTVRKLFRLGRVNRDVRRAERFLYAREGRFNDLLTVGIMATGAAIFLGPEIGVDVALAGSVGLVLVTTVVVLLSPYLNRGVRTALIALVWLIGMAGFFSGLVVAFDRVTGG